MIAAACRHRPIETAGRLLRRRPPIGLPPRLPKQDGCVCNTRNALVTAGEVTETTKRGIIKAEQVLVVEPANLDKCPVPQVAEPLL